MSNTTKIIGRDLPDGAYLEIEATERDGSDGLSPGFAVTGTLYERHGTWSGRARKRNGRDCDAAGQVVEEIRRAAPELEPVLRVHLASPDGVPMHALANGWYFYCGGASAYEREQVAKGRDYGYSRMLETSDHDRAARALNVSPDDLPAGLDQDGFRSFVESLTEAYAAQAAEARAVLSALVDGDGVES